MNTNRLYQLFLAHFRINTRYKLTFFFALIFPLIFIGVFGIAFTQSDPGNSTLPIAFINYDEGIPDNTLVYNSDGSIATDQVFSYQFVDVLDTITYQDNTTNFLKLTEFSPDDLSGILEDVERRKFKALLLIPSDFSLGVMAAMQNLFDLTGMDLSNYPDANYNTNITLRGDGSLLDFAIVSNVVDQVTQIFFKLGNTATIGGSLEIESAFETRGFRAFDYIVPGLVIFAIINNLATVATVSLTDVKSHLLDRFRLTKMATWEYPFSLILSQLAMSLIQIPIMFGASILFGFPVTIEILYAYFFAVLVSLSLSGMGLIIASVANDENSVGGLASLIGTPMAFLAGAFFQMPNPTIIKNGGVLGDHELGIFDLLPPRPAIDTLRLILINDWPLSSLIYEISLLFTLTVIYLSIGIFLYSRKHLRTQ